MKLRKLEAATLAITIAITFFTGGYLFGRSQSAGNRAVPAVTTSRADTGASPEASSLPEAEAPPDTASPVESVRDMLYGRININTASLAELTDLPGIGEQLAGRIVEYREANGAFSSVEDVMNVSGIGEKKLDAIRDYITAG